MKGVCSLLVALFAASGGAYCQNPFLTSVAVADDAPGEILLCREYLLAFEASGALARIVVAGEKAGQKLWTREVSGPVGSPAVVEDVILIAGRAPPRLIALSPVAGEVLWESPLPRPPTAGPVGQEVRFARPADAPEADSSSRPATVPGARAGDAFGSAEGREFIVVVGTGDGLSARSLLDGSPIWSAPCGAVTGPIVCDANYLACTTAASEIVVLDWRGRQVVRVGGPGEQDAPIPGMPPMLCGDRLLYCADKGLFRVELPSGERSRWRDTEWMGPITAPPILAESHVYFGTKGRGLVCVGPPRQ